MGTDRIGGMMAEHARKIFKGTFSNGSPLSVELFLDTSNPLTVHAIFRYRGGGGEWHILLTLIEEVVEGGFAESNDLRLTKEGNQVCLRLDGEDGVAEVLIAFSALQSFLESVQEATKKAIDGELSEMLKGR